MNALLHRSIGTTGRYCLAGRVFLFLAIPYETEQRTGRGPSFAAPGADEADEAPGVGSGPADVDSGPADVD